MDYEKIAAYLAGQSGEAERQEVEHWRRESTRNEQTFQRWQLLWQASQWNTKYFEPDIEQAWQKINPATKIHAPFKVAHQKQPASANLFLWAKRVAAVLLLMISLGWAVWKTADYFTTPTLTWLEKLSPEWEKTELLLEDGTKVWLNAQSKLRYPQHFSTDTREVYLEGEAFFEVARNPQKPFLIHAQQSVTQVLGTSFNIRGYVNEANVELTVVTGKVSFTQKSATSVDKETLLHGQKAIFDKASGKISLYTNQDTNFLAWKTGKLVFQDTPLKEALKTLQNYYHVSFKTDNPLLLNCRFTGSFNQAKIEEVLEIFAFGSAISHQKQNDVYMLSGAGCQ